MSENSGSNGTENREAHSIECMRRFLLRGVSRRTVIKGSLSLFALSLLGGEGCQSVPGGRFGWQGQGLATREDDNEKRLSLIGFKSIEPSDKDYVRISDGYRFQILLPWGDPVGDGPPFRGDGSNSAAEQALQAGTHHDGISFFSLPSGSSQSDHGLLAINHEYVARRYLHSDKDLSGPLTPAMVEKEIAAHGVSIVEIRKQKQRWEIVRPSKYARRITGNTRIGIGGPAAGSAKLATSQDLAGRSVRGTLGNCACGQTPWGTYLTCEENFHQYFSGSAAKLDPTERMSLARYGVPSPARWRWFVGQERFAVEREPQEANRFGWIVEVDPYDPTSRPVKRTAMGRFRHENAAFLVGEDNHFAVYSGDDAPFEYIYKFVADRPFQPGAKAENRDLLDRGKLYVARFDEDGTGHWLELRHGLKNLDRRGGFRDQADLLIRTREAADIVGATKMDRPEWIAVEPTTKKVYATLTNNVARTRAAIDRANPRHDNIMGHIIQWEERNRDPRSETFSWSVLLLAGDPRAERTNDRGSTMGDCFACPDGLMIDSRGLMWIQTDIKGASLGKGRYAPFGNNQMLALDPARLQKGASRFLTGPAGCELTGMTMTPDMKTFFVNIQHPGESKESHWPDGGNTRPRSATLAITRNNGGPVGA